MSAEKRIAESSQDQKRPDCPVPSYREGRREAIEQCIDHLRINGWFEAAEKCLAERFRRELYGMHDG